MRWLITYEVFSVSDNELKLENIFKEEVEKFLQEHSITFLRSRWDDIDLKVHKGRKLIGEIYSTNLIRIERRDFY